jgi:RHS repeat-associated protein
VPEDLSTTSSVDDPLDVRVAPIRAANQPSPELLEDIDQAVGEYLKRQPAGLEAVDHQAELEELLGSQWAEQIRRDQANYYEQKAQFCRDGPELGKNAEADTVMMFNGQLVYSATDLRINGAGIDFVFTRTYKNQAYTRGPLGYNWDHSYNLWLREEENTLVRSSGALREDRYVRHEIHGYYVPPPGFHDTIEASGNSFTLLTPSNVRFFYEREGQTERHHIRRIQDRNGNYLAFTYDADSRLERVEINTPNRWVTFQYDSQDRITAITVYPVTYRKPGGPQPVSRVWRYTYDDFGDLLRVTTPDTDQHPAGLTTCYEYSSSFYPGELAHNLLRIYDPAGQLFLENEYGIQKGVLTYNRVVRQRQGNGEYQFEYEDVLPEGSWDYRPEEIPAHRTLFYQRNGHVVEHVYNRLGNLIVKRERVIEECRPRELISRYRYNPDGALMGSLSPEGSVVQFLYGREDFYARPANPGDLNLKPWQDPNLTAAERRKFGKQLAVVKRGRAYTPAMLSLARGLYGDIFPSIYAAQPDDVIVKFTYEPAAQQIATVSDPRYTQSADPRHPEDSTYRRQLTRYEYSLVPRVNLRRVRHPDTTFPSPLPDGTTGLTGVTSECLRYDARGRLLRARDPEGNLARSVYFRGGPRNGYLRREIRDEGGLALTTAHEVNEAGQVIAQTNPRGVRSQAVVDELGRVVETISGGSGFREESFFDRNGLLARQDRDNLDDTGQPSPDGDEVRTFRYDAQNNLVRETFGGADLSRHHTTRHCYNSSNLRVETVLPRGNIHHYTYDERLLLRSTTRGAGSPATSTVQTFHDGDRRKILVVDGRGNLTRFRYDPLNREVAVIDALGNLQQNEYDKLSNPTVERFFEPRTDGAYDLLSRRTYEYDERANRVREIAYLFQAPIRTADVEADPDAEFNTALAQGSVTPVVTQYYYDRNRRLFRVVDNQNRETVYEYDGANRGVVERDTLGNYTRTFYDENGNVVRVDRHEVVRNPQTGTVLRQDVFSTLNEYDDLDRRVATMDGLGNRTTFTYDSRDNLTSVTDPLGNVHRYEYDVFSRRVREIVEMTATGLGGGPRLADIVTQYEYDENGNRVAVIDARGARTRFEFDPLDRSFRTIYPDGTDTRLEYDLDDNVVARVNNNGLRILYDVDPLKRVLRVNLDKTRLHPGSPYPAGAEEFEQYEYDGLGRVLLQRGDFCEIRLRYDSLGRAYEESVRFTTPYAPPAGLLTLRRAFDTLSNRTALVYPNGRDVRHYYDALNRVARLENRTNGAGYPGSTALPAQYDIARYEYRGLRLRRMAFYNGTRCELAYDGAGRVIRLQHYSGANRLLETQQLYDAAGNCRYQRDAPALPGRPGGEAYAYDSLYRLTRYERRTIPAINPTQFAPPGAPLPRNALNGQQAIHQAIGPLEQDTLNYTYRYDSLGNRQEERLPNQPALAYIANTLNQYQSVGQAAFQYDRNGNLIDDGSRLYRYNYRDRLSQVVDQATGTELLRLLYDASGRLILIRESGGAIHLLYDGPNAIEEYASGNLSAQYVNENGADRRIQLAQRGQECWYHQDLPRSTRLLTGAGGQLVVRYEYEPFGSLAVPVAHPNPYAFAGKRLFQALNLYDSRARQYSPTLGRFLQRDPKGIAGALNLYTYTGNNPATFVDPLGMEETGVISPGSEPGPYGVEVVGSPPGPYVLRIALPGEQVRMREVVEGGPQQEASEVEEPSNRYRPSLEEKAMLNGTVRFLVNFFNPATYGSPEAIQKTEEALDRIRLEPYSPEEYERGIAYEQGWAMILQEAVFLSGSVHGAASSLPTAARELIARSGNVASAHVAAPPPLARGLIARSENVASAAARKPYVPPSVRSVPVGGEVGGVPGLMIGKTPLYGPFYRVGKEAVLREMLSSLTLRGRGVIQPGGGWGPFPSANAYTRERFQAFPAGTQYLEFYTTVQPTDVGITQATWTLLRGSSYELVSTRPGIRAVTLAGEDWAEIDLSLARIGTLR